MITQERLLELFRYEPETGDFILLRTRRGSRDRPGARVGTKCANGYLYIRVDSVLYLSHRLAWLYVYGEQAAGEIDHINGNRVDNRIINLRLATRNQQSANSRGWSRRGVGMKGAFLDRRDQGWYAKIKIDQRQLYLGRFPSEQAAHDAYMEAAGKYFGEFARAV